MQFHTSAHFRLYRAVRKCSSIHQPETVLSVFDVLVAKATVYIPKLVCKNRNTSAFFSLGKILHFPAALAAGAGEQPQRPPVCPSLNVYFMVALRRGKILNQNVCQVVWI